MSQPPNTAQGPNTAQPANTATGQQAAQRPLRKLLTDFQEHVNWHGVGKRRALYMLKGCRKAMRAKYGDKYNDNLQLLVNQLFETNQARRVMLWNQREYDDSTEDEANKYGGWSDLAEPMIDSARRYRDELVNLIALGDEIGDSLKEMLDHDRNVRVPNIEKALMDDEVDLMKTQEEELRNRQQRRADFQKSDYVGDAMHRFVRFGGGNPNSSLGLWVELDNEWNITDRTVVKDTSYEEPDQIDDWKNPVYWHILSPDAVRMPLEAHIMERLRDSGSENVVRLRGWGVMPEVLAHRLIMEWCPYRDLAMLLTNYKNSKNYKNSERFIPEPFIWHVFESMVLAGLYMQQGGVNMPQPNWREIIHLDIKPENVFIALHPGPTQVRDNWNMYPTLKLGDYGLACEWNGGNPKDYTGRGTETFKAPEQDIQNQDIPLTSKTNVYGIGITLMALMSPNFEYGPGPESWSEYWESDQQRLPEDAPVLTRDMKKNYTRNLSDLVLDCTEADPNDRPTLANLLRDIRTLTTADLSIRTKGARNSRPRDRIGREHSLKYMPGDRYEIGRLWGEAEQDHEEKGRYGYGYYVAPPGEEEESEEVELPDYQESSSEQDDDNGQDDPPKVYSSGDDFILGQGAGTSGAAAVDDGTESNGGDDVLSSEKSDTDEEDRETVSEQEKRQRRRDMKRNNVRSTRGNRD